MNNRVRYTRQNIISNSFYQLPKFLFDAELASLSNDARVLYALLRNRHEISIKNDWYDNNGEVFLYFKREDMQSMLSLSDKTITKAMKELKDFFLLEEVRQGISKPNKIYLLSASVEQFGIGTAETLENTMNRKIYDSRTGDSTNQDTEILRPNHNNKIHNNNNKNQVMSSQSDSDRQDEDETDEQSIQQYTDFIKSGIRYDDFFVSRPHDITLIDEFINIILDTILTVSKTVKIEGKDKPKELVKGNLLKLTYSDIDHCLNQFKTYTKPIGKKKQFILTMLYNAKMEQNSHYTNLVKSDMWQGGDFNG